VEVMTAFLSVRFSAETDFRMNRRIFMELGRYCIFLYMFFKWKADFRISF